MKIGITGGAGFIGSNLAARLALDHHEIFVFDNLSSGVKKNLENIRHTFVSGDLIKFDDVQNFVSHSNLEYIVHLGAVGSVPRSINLPRMSFENNAVATLNILEAARISEIPVIFSSSSSVYGSNTNMPKKEQDWVSPISPYAASKLSAEALCHAYRESYSMNILIFRLFNVYGPKQSSDGNYAALIPKWIDALINKREITVYGDGQQKRDFTFVEDVTTIFANSISTLIKVPKPINLAFGNPVTINSIIEILRRQFGFIKVNYSEPRHGDIKDSAADPSFLESLGLMTSAPTNFEDGLLKTVEWYLEKHG